MQDIVRHHLIPLAPIEFLDVCVWTRKVALKCVSSLQMADHAAGYRDRLICRRGVYYRVIRLLGAAQMWAETRTFADMYFDETYFGIRVWRLLRNGDKSEAIELYRYVLYYSNTVSDKMIEIFKLRFTLDDADNVKQYFSLMQYNELKNYYRYGVQFDHHPAHYGRMWRMRNRRDDATTELK